ncbi:phosphodiester glycosidase family protein [Streptomyces chumphonensis]|uniref:phosphodiester glycosidase family protein n=1 Tax=Streptomyces chumphonensis TaxID=1214925 RepID=UPI003D74188B
MRLFPSTGAPATTGLRRTGRAAVAAGLLVVTVLTVLVLTGGPGTTGTAADDGRDRASGHLPLGPAELAEQRTVTVLAPGVEHLAIRRGGASPDERWTLTVGLGTSEAEVAELRRRVREAGHTPVLSDVVGADPGRRDGTGPGTLVRVGAYAGEREAEQVREELAERGVRTRVQHTSGDGRTATGPWSVHVLVIDPAEFEGRLTADLAAGTVAGRETVSSLVGRTGALAGVNGGFFVLGERDRPGQGIAGTEGDLAGVSVIRGELLSEAVNGRPALVLPDGSGAEATIRRLRTRLSVRVGGASHEVTGLNRRPGLIVNCGGVGAQTPLARPAHDWTCGNAHELIAITPEFGARAPGGAGHQIVLDGDGRVTGVRDGGGGPVPADGLVLRATGDAATWLRRHATIGSSVEVTEDVVDVGTGSVLPRSAGTSVVNGGPLLLRDGALALDPERDGWSPRDIAATDRTEWFTDWYLRRKARSAAGVTADGRLLLMTADGDQPDRGIGLTIGETAEVMRSLGAVDAVNLDGGGSAAMAVDGTLVSSPSDAAGERPVADALLVLP